MSASIRSRFAFSLGANLSRALLSFLTGLLVARGLGPREYGEMTFLLGTFLALRQLMDAGSSTAFFTLLSQRQRGRRFVGWYLAWLGAQFLLPLLAIGLLFPSTWLNLIWKGEQRSLVLLAFLAAYLQSTLWPSMLQMGESQRLTRWVQIVALEAAGAHFLLMAIAWWQDWLSVHLILAATAAEWAIGAWVIAKQLNFPPTPDGDEDPASVLKEFGCYCVPMLPYSWLGFAYEFADRWLLQTYGGSVQQAYYAVAYQFGAVAAIATASILNVFWKEIAEAHHRGNQERVAMLYSKVSRGLLFVSAAVAGFLVPWSEEILRLTLGQAYVAGTAALGLMFLYPVHQSMGQIGGTMLYATGRVRAQVAVGMAGMTASMLVAYYVLAPAAAPIPGLGLGSVGLAAKMVGVQFVTVNVMAYYLARELHMKFDWLDQLLVLGGFLGLGWLAYTVPQWLFGAGLALWGRAMVSGTLYVALGAALFWVAPSLAGLSREEIRVAASRFRR